MDSHTPTYVRTHTHTHTPTHTLHTHTPGKDKFLLQFIKVPVEVAESMSQATASSEPNTARLADLWAQTEVLKRAAPEAQGLVLERKLRCLFSKPPTFMADPASLSAGSLPAVGGNSASSSPGRGLGESMGSSATLPSAPIIASLERELRECKDKLKTMQTASEVYKAELER